MDVRESRLDPDATKRLTSSLDGWAIGPRDQP